jgi:peptide-methionine (S)-S-oxide reductase
MATELATLGGGCFWCLDAAYRGLKGVSSVVSGYAGGEVPDPAYRQVCSGTTGHAEVVQITFDPGLIDYETLLRVFFTLHDPTTLNRQGADVGTQYRSVIFYHSGPQRETAERLIAELTAERLWPGSIVTQLAPVPDFYPAEAYHQDYFRQNPAQGYCQVVIAPKLAKVRERHLSLLSAQVPGSSKPIL